MIGDMSGDDIFVVRPELGRGVGGCEAAFFGAMYVRRPISTE